MANAKQPQSDLDEIEARVAAAKAARTDEDEGPLLTASEEENEKFRMAKGRTSTLAPYQDQSRVLGIEDFYLPRLKLLQGLSKECKGDNPKPQGHWYLEGNPDTFGPEVTIAPMFAQKSRAYLIPGRGLMCRSTDMVYGQGNPGIACADCVLKEWPDDDNKNDPHAQKRGGPPCSEVMNFPCIIVPKEPGGEYQVGLLAFSRTGFKQGKLINTIHAGSMRDDYYENLIVVGRFSTSNAKGDYYVPTVTRGGLTDERTLEFARSMSPKIDSQAVSRTLEQEEFADD